VSTPNPPAVGSIGWLDLTVPNAPAIRDFYARVVGWTVTPVPMGDYDDFVMNASETGVATAGICNAQGRNAGLPAVWLMYITVADLNASLAECRAAGGRVIAEPRSAGGASRFAVIEDPAGAAVALYDAGIRASA
jgi:uncharacterized protein